MSDHLPTGATPIDPDEAEGLIPDHVTTRGELDELEEANIQEGLEWALGRSREVVSRRLRKREKGPRKGYRILKGRGYQSPHDLRADFPTASFLGARRTVFNIGGNKYRLVVEMRYDLGRVYVRDVLTQEGYYRKSINGAL
jgi:mRNA-degrading endonuclease HigB of HigAB toxin-antitoxin module